MKIIAHRGYSGRYPELSRLAFEKALELPIHGIECDVRITRDGHAVLIHDPVIDRVSDGRGRVSRMTLAQLQEYNFGTEDQPQTVLTLDDVLDMIRRADGHHLYIETKHPVCRDLVPEREVVSRLRHAGLLDDPRIHFICFSAPAVARMRRLAPQVERFHLRRRVQRWINPMDVHPGRPDGRGVSLGRAQGSPHLVGRYGPPTYMWTVNEPGDMLWARSVGVDLMATDEPEVALEVLTDRSL